jgi:hypothetical protein
MLNLALPREQGVPQKEQPSVNAMIFVVCVFCGRPTNQQLKPQSQLQGTVGKVSNLI